MGRRFAGIVACLALVSNACGPASSGPQSVYEPRSSTKGLANVEARRSVLSVHDRGPLQCILALEGVEDGAQLGSSACALPDQDGDGRADFAVGAWNALGALPLVSWAPNAPSVPDGFVLILRGDGDPLGWIAEDSHNPCVGARLSALNDIDGDGAHEWSLRVTDVSLRALALGFTSKSAARVVSGARKNLLHAAVGGFAPFVHAFGDLDGDGCADLVTGVDDHAPDCTRVQVLSGRTGALIYGFEVAGAAFASVVALPDLDADGAPDFAIGWRELREGDDRRGAVDVRSGRRLAVHRARAPFEHFGHSLLVVRDFDGDGLGELLVGTDNARSASEFVGRVTCLSLPTGRVLFEQEGRHEYAQLGQSIVDVGDLDGDGASDVAVSSKRAVGADKFVGSTSVCSLTAHGLVGFLELPGSEWVALGDLDGDGRGEFACLSPSWPDSPSFRGRVLVFRVER